MQIFQKINYAIISINYIIYEIIYAIISINHIFYEIICVNYLAEYSEYFAIKSEQFIKYILLLLINSQAPIIAHKSYLSYFIEDFYKLVDYSEQLVDCSVQFIDCSEQLVDLFYKFIEDFYKLVDYSEQLVEDFCYIIDNFY